MRCTSAIRYLGGNTYVPSATGSNGFPVNVSEAVHVERGDVIGIRWRAGEEAVPCTTTTPCRDGMSYLMGRSSDIAIGEMIMTNPTRTCVECSVLAHVKPQPGMYMYNNL